ncbi:DedA family protein [Garicola koreensis]|uniref:Membrane protein DedA with SNARE-associated domain n=1 Tax=Garicola koreensis TaxID=1262554 RepID=A0A7W5TQP5_9MICC|nr:VTT domain-containing protein [Garicola koreensis]MBB3667980.1 membrane protein DedA with SNARE-associated domain [Garicola koreensis]
MIDLLEDWGLWFLPVQALAVALTAFVPPLPSEVMVIASGAMAADQLLPIAWVIAATVTGCLVGDVGLYMLFRYRFLRVLYRWRWGRQLHRLVLRTALRAGRANTWVGLLLIRWIPGGRTTSMVTAGMMRMQWSRLILLAVLGAVIWSLWLVGLGYVTGSTTGLSLVANILIGLAVGTLVGSAFAFMTTRRRRARTQV